MNVSRGARERVRAEITREIRAAARRQLARVGAAALSQRAVARELGLASSALYRYFPSRDDLLTVLIVDAYDALGAHVEAADASCQCDRFGERWLAVCRAVRQWALAHPHEYALIFGSPVPGYHAPTKITVPPAIRVPKVLCALLRDAACAGALQPGLPFQPPSGAVAADAASMQATLMSGVPTDAVVRLLIAWTHLFGVVSFELFGHLRGTVTDNAAYFDHTAALIGHFIGLPDD